MFYSVDRIIDKKAVLIDDDNTELIICLDEIPFEICETDVLKSQDGKQFTIDIDEKNRRKKVIVDLQNKLFGN